MTIQNDLITFISKTGKIAINELNPDTEIYNAGLVSSLTLLDLMAFIEGKYRLIIKPEELVEENFKNFKTIASFVASKIRTNGIPG